MFTKVIVGVDGREGGRDANHARAVLDGAPCPVGVAPAGYAELEQPELRPVAPFAHAGRLR